MTAPAACLPRPAAARSTPVVQRLALSIAEVAEVFDLAPRHVRWRIERGLVPHLRISAGRLAILEGDASVLIGSPPAGIETIAEALRYRRPRLWLHHIAEALGVCPPTLKALARVGEFPARRTGGGWWFVMRDDLVHWLTEHRVPARWEAAA